MAVLMLALIAAAPSPVKPPKTPEGLPPCVSPLLPERDLPRTAGESIRYFVSVDGLPVGALDFKILRQGNYEGQPVTEYRSLFKLDGLVAVILPADGRAAAIVPERATSPLVAMNRYKMDKNDFDERQTFSEGGRRASSTRAKNGVPTEEQREFPGPAADFVTSFYLVRSLPAGMRGCALVYGNQRAYTFWVEPDGEEKVATPVGPRSALRYRVRYASDKGKKPIEGRFWLANDATRLPYKAELTGPYKLEAEVHLYEIGKGNN
jgi:hypothetical protein